MVAISCESCAIAPCKPSCADCIEICAASCSSLKIEISLLQCQFIIQLGLFGFQFLVERLSKRVSLLRGLLKLGYLLLNLRWNGRWTVLRVIVHDVLRRRGLQPSRPLASPWEIE